MNPRVVAIVQARMGSRRLPQKVLADIQGRSMLERIVARLRRARRPDEVVVATSAGPADDPIAALCERLAVRCSRGSAEDVLDRFRQAAAENQADIIVRVTGDCPLIDPDLVDETIRAFQEASPPVDFACNRLPWERTYPIGTDTEVCSREALEAAWKEADQTYQREHVMPFLYENQDRFRIVHVRSSDATLGEMRWTVDQEEDLAFVREIYSRFVGRDDFSWLEVVDLLRREPELARINMAVVHKSHRDVG
ncbi:MAG: acylneuraminate cytidylyltransferase family protein [Anaerolineales bacterium]|jgi:spore coat polysaccharide biosynthesis protein SpsF|nr:acylneuraminate cytidylyltransferase family protein [Anaerolineales bacterium]